MMPKTAKVTTETTNDVLELFLGEADNLWKRWLQIDTSLGHVNMVIRLVNGEGEHKGPLGFQMDRETTLMVIERLINHLPEK